MASSECEEQTATPCRERLGEIIKSQEENSLDGKDRWDWVWSLLKRGQKYPSGSRRELARLACQVSHKFSLFCQLQFSTHTFSPTATIRQLQSVAAGSSLEFTIPVWVTFFSSLAHKSSVVALLARKVVRASTLNRRATIGKGSARLSWVTAGGIGSKERGESGLGVGFKRGIIKTCLW